MDKPRKRKIKLVSESPYCYWCGKKVRLTEGNPGRQDHDHATLDHIYTRRDPSRWAAPNNTERTVLSCYECNQKRSIEDKTKYTEEQLADLAGDVKRALESLPVYQRPSAKVLAKFRLRHLGIPTGLHKHDK